MLKLFKHLGGGLLLAAIIGAGLPYQAFPQVGSPGVMTIPGPKERAPEGGSQPSEPAGGLDIRIHPEEGKMRPPAELLVNSPGGRKLGNDPRRRLVYQEIPGSYYEKEGLEDAESGEPGPESGVIYISAPDTGTYTLQVIGLETGKYTLELMGFFPENSSRAEFLDVAILKGEIQEYAIDYSGQKRGSIEVKRLR